MYNVKILLDSVSQAGKRITTFELTYPRFVHAELLTHRLFSKNSASSRAIPVKKMLDNIRNDPAMPLFWGRNQSGMQAAEELSSVCSDDMLSERDQAKRVWLKARDEAVFYAERMMDLGLHKQIANRVTEPWMFITVILTSTEFENWFNLRDSPFAQPEIAWVAKEMRQKMAESEPNWIEEGEWHLPLVDIDREDAAAFDQAFPKLLCDESFQQFSARRMEARKKISAGRCARVSYLTHDGKRDPKEDVVLADRLASSGHWSPFEHASQALSDPELRVGNFMGWRQYRADVDPGFVTLKCPSCKHTW